MVDILFFGIQGSGKGTQAKKLAAHFGYELFEAGGELRKVIASGSELGKMISARIDNGNMVPFETIITIAKNFIDAAPTNKPILFDGIPRDFEQMEEFEKIMDNDGRDSVGINLLLPEHLAKERILARAKKEGRADDMEEKFIDRRLQLFRVKTIPVVEEYRRIGKIYDVDAEGSVDEIFERLKKVVEEAEGLRKSDAEVANEAA